MTGSTHQNSLERMPVPSPTVDIHIHSIASGHAFSTVEEIVSAAAERSLEGIAITDHGPALPGGHISIILWRCGLSPSLCRG